jgi:hypothetical protein
MERSLENAYDAYAGGAKYNGGGVALASGGTAADSLAMIYKYVFRDKVVTLAQLRDILDNNWEGYETLRRYALNKYSYFGNDNDEVDAIAARLVSDFADICDEISESEPYDTPAGISTFGRQLEWSAHRFATPYGKCGGEVLSGNFSPTPGTDRESATAIIKSYCKADLRRTVSGAALDIKLLASNVKSDKTKVTISFEGKRIETGLSKMGAIVGDLVEVGCNSVLNPGTVIGAESVVYPLSSVRGYIPPKSIFKTGGVVISKK